MNTFQVLLTEMVTLYSYQISVLRREPEDRLLQWAVSTRYCIDSVYGISIGPQQSEQSPEGQTFQSKLAPASLASWIGDEEAESE